jgi:hypothetical protein
MKWFLFALLLAACPSEHIETSGDMCSAGVAQAVDPASGVCVIFASPCEVPVEWEACSDFASPCLTDDDCLATQSCPIPADGEEPVCVDNPVCRSDGECGEGFESCDLAAREDEDPSVPEGLCVRAEAGVPAPADDTCVANSQCSELEICPAQYGGCSEGEPRDVTCPSRCEAACASDSDCPIEGEVCNAGEVEGDANGEGDGPPIAAVGWCVPG